MSIPGNGLTWPLDMGTRGACVPGTGHAHLSCGDSYSSQPLLRKSEGLQPSLTDPGQGSSADHSPVSTGNFWGRHFPFSL